MSLPAGWVLRGVAAVKHVPRRFVSFDGTRTPPKGALTLAANSRGEFVVLVWRGSGDAIRLLERATGNWVPGPGETMSLAGTCNYVDGLIPHYMRIVDENVTHDTMATVVDVLDALTGKEDDDGDE